MRLADFLDDNVERILCEWEPFASTLLPAARHLNSAGLRDHAEKIVRAIAIDLRTPQSALEQDLKARGLAAANPTAPHTAAQTHAILRAAAGFTAQQLVAEYRALRASVLRLWLDDVRVFDHQVADDMRRFNESIDQAVAESVDHFTQEVDRWRNVFLGVLGHELRGPLDAIMLTAKLLERLPDGTPAGDHLARMRRSGERMKSLLDDLLDFNRDTLGFGIAVNTAPVDIAQAVAEEVELRKTLSPQIAFHLRTTGDTRGSFDAQRVQQLLGNLLTNAVKYGDGKSGIEVALQGLDEHVRLTVTNTGPGLAPEQIHSLFEPLARLPTADAEIERTSLGLGLYIVKAIVMAHEGSVSATSSDGETVFTVDLPKRL